jgi:hypothetical protein
MVESETFSRVVVLIASDEYVFSRHALKEAAEDGLLAQDLIAGVSLGEVIEDYPDYHAGPCCLVFQLRLDLSLWSKNIASLLRRLR